MNPLLNTEAHGTLPRRLFRAARAGLVLTSLVGSLAAAPRRTPSSLEKSGATLRITHSHVRVIGCKHDSANNSCIEQRQPSAAGTDLTLTPSPGELVSRPERPRQVMSVSLPKRLGATTLDVRVDSGNWELAWADQRTSFRVDAQRDFGVQLKTVSGACAIEQNQCRLQDAIVRREVIVPPEFAGAQ